MDGQSTAFALVVFIIFIALVFDYVNGFHDAANSIATVVATRVLSPGVAVAWAAFFNFIAFAVFGTCCGENHRRRYGQYHGDCGRFPALCSARRIVRRDHLESYNVVSRSADIEFARARRRLCRCRDCGVRCQAMALTA